jgi:hypothetical protein
VNEIERLKEELDRRLFEGKGHLYLYPPPPGETPWFLLIPVLGPEGYAVINVRWRPEKGFDAIKLSGDDSPEWSEVVGYAEALEAASLLIQGGNGFH